MSTRKKPLSRNVRLSTGSHGPAQRNRYKLSSEDIIYLVVALIESFLVTTLVLSAFIILDARAGLGDARVRGTSLYMSTFVLASIFSLLYSWDAITAHNVVQLIGHLFFELCLLTWSSVEMYQTRLALEHLDKPGACVFRNGDWDCLGDGSLWSVMLKVLAFVPPIIFLSMCAFLYLSIKLYRQFGWEVYRLVNASPLLRTIHRNYQTFQSLIKLLFFFAAAFCMMYIIILPLQWRHTAELVITVIALPIFYPTLILLMWAVKREHKLFMGSGLVVLVAGEGYFVFKMVSLFLGKWGFVYDTTRYTLVVFSAFAIVLNISITSLLLILTLHAATIVYGVICMRHFGQGLRPCHEDPANGNKWWMSKKYEAEQEEYNIDNDNRVPFLVD